jgi:hypothetical protein
MAKRIFESIGRSPYQNPYVVRNAIAAKLTTIQETLEIVKTIKNRLSGAGDGNTVEFSSLLPKDST